MAAGQVVALTAQPITTVSPNSKTDDDQSITLGEVLEAINQLSHAVNYQINQSNTKIASLQSEVETSTTAVQRDMDSSRKAAAAVRDKIDFLFELIEKGETR